MDETVAPLFQDLLVKTGLDISIFTFPAGESSKTRETKQRLEDQMLAKGFGRGCALIAMGGGVTLDLGGFIAATYCRGVPLIHIPTTLLAMVDACIGGKTGVNTPQGKNLIGAFYPAAKVLIDVDTLDSLPEAQMRSGMAEVIKYGLTLDPTLLEESDLERRIFRSCALKKRIIEEDYQESGLRRVLNFGHTVGHAIELLTEYKILHGDAVALGMAIECAMSVEMGYLSEKSFLQIMQLLPLQELHMEAEKLMEAMRHDKKSSLKSPRFVVLKEIGEVEPFSGSYCTEVNPEILERALTRYASAIFSRAL